MVKNKNGYPCPCCGFLTLSDDTHENFEICPICCWEDDDVQYGDPTFKGGANQESLVDARKNFIKFRASSLKFIDRVRPPNLDELP